MNIAFNDIMAEFVAVGIWPEQVSRDDLLDVMMLRGTAVEWTGGRVVELIDFRQSEEQWYDRKEWQ